ncbi:MAG: bifunctional oligoribonuclease/PAP phosphatase NrnA [Oscillospiraceae bacterium]|jgi:phosphoesterase RecJ-like protein|nr:bifunctional oligoribonuclease/PAP phosphatase NrnA [Oscillospiraceae bacterium]
MNNIVRFLQQNNHFLLLTHRRPDGDTLGSAAALCAGLRSLGKAAYLWRNPEITGRYLPFTEPYFAPEGYEHSTTIAVDTASASLLGKDWDGPVHLRIDHHPATAGFADMEYSDPSAAACGEVIQELLERLGVTLTKEIAELLYIAISTDTGCFRYSNTTARTHRHAAALIDAGIDAQMLNVKVFAKSRERLAMESAIAANIAYSAGGRVAAASLTLEEKTAVAVAEDDLENIAGIAQGIEGVQVALMLREEADSWRVSCRTSEPYAANAICGVLGGGGHSRAAGAEIKRRITPEAARAQVLAALWEMYPELRD